MCLENAKCSFKNTKYEKGTTTMFESVKKILQKLCEIHVNFTSKALIMT
jgi:hypothetical protein